VLDYPADDIWAVIRPFDHYAWAVGGSEAIIKQDKAGFRPSGPQDFWREWRA
jgi:hypothetical protein